MLKLTRLAAIVFATFLLSGSSQAALPATAHDAVGSIVTTPWQATGQRVTVVTLTNALASPVTVHWTALNKRWNGPDQTCPLTAMETTFFVFESQPGNPLNTQLTTECRTPSGSPPGIFPGSPDNVLNFFIPGPSAADREGFIVFHMTRAPAGPPVPPVNPVSTQSLIADFTVIDFAQGYAYSANGWHFQNQGSTQNNTVLVPTILATSFIAPDDDITAELLLYTLHGRIGGPAPVSFGSYLYDDDENRLSLGNAYDCFTVLALDDPAWYSVGATRPIGPGGRPYFVGHITLFALGSNAINFATGFPGFRSASIGYIIQTIGARLPDDGADLNDNQSLGGTQGNFPHDLGVGIRAAWARKMLKTETTQAQCNALDRTQDPAVTCGSAAGIPNP